MIASDAKSKRSDVISSDENKCWFQFICGLGESYVRLGWYLNPAIFLQYYDTFKNFFHHKAVTAMKSARIVQWLASDSVG